MPSSGERLNFAISLFFTYLILTGLVIAIPIVLVFHLGFYWIPIIVIAVIFCGCLHSGLRFKHVWRKERIMGIIGTVRLIGFFILILAALSALGLYSILIVVLGAIFSIMVAKIITIILSAIFALIVCVILLGVTFAIFGPFTDGH